MHFRLDRMIPVPLAEQIKGQLIYAISYGHLTVGEALPSVRELSASLGVAPMTISQVYRDLARQGLVKTRPGAGTFVADIARVDASAALHASRGTLQQLSDGYVRQAMMLGASADQISKSLAESLERHNSGGALHLRLLMVGNFAAATEAYARAIEAILHDLSVVVQPVLLGQLLAEPERYEPLVSSAKLAITVPPRLQEVSALLAPRGLRVAAVAFRVTAETRRRLSAISAGQRVGIVTTYPEFLNTIVENVAAYGFATGAPLCAMLGQDAHIREMMSQIDVLVYASGSEAVCDWLPAHVEPVEFRHSPEPESVNRLRPLLA